MHRWTKKCPSEENTNTALPDGLVAGAVKASGPGEDGSATRSESSTAGIIMAQTVRRDVTARRPRDAWPSVGRAFRRFLVRLDYCRVHAVTGMGEFRDNGLGAQGAGHPDRVPQLFRTRPEPAGGDVNDLVGGRRRGVDAGAEIRHQQEL